jgi:hypothetical protein
MSVANIITRVQVILDDPAGTWADEDYVLSFLKIYAEDVAIEFAKYDLSYSTVETVLPALPAFTTDLSSFQASGGSLAGLMEPISVEWRPAGSTDEDWVVVPACDKVPDVDPDENTVKGYEWRGGLVYLAKCAQAVDLRVRYTQVPGLYEDQAQEEVVGIRNVLAYGTAAMMWGVRGNAQRATETDAKCQVAKDNFESLMVMKEQKVDRKVGRSRQSSTFGMFRPPNG